MLPTSLFPAVLSRLLVVVALFVGMSTPVVAGQVDADGAKDSQESDATGTPEVSPGLVGEGEYVSPQFDIEINWTDAWDLGDFENPLVAYAVGGNFDAPITSDPTNGDVVFLMDTATGSSVLNFAIATNTSNLSPSTFEQLLGQPETLENNLFVAPDSEILLLDANDTAAAIMARDANDTDHIIYLTVNFVPDEEFYVWTGIDLWEPEHYERALTAFAEDVEISDVDPFSIQDVDGLIALAQSEPAPVTAEADTPEENDGTPVVEPTAENDGTPAADAASDASAGYPGLIAEGDYESPQYGTEITWTDSWIIDERRDQPVGSDEDAGFDSVFLTDAATENTSIFITVEELASSDPDDILDQITADGYNEDIFGIDPDSKVLLSDATADSAAILVVDDTGAEPIVIYMEVHALDEDGLVAFVELRANASDIDEDVLTAFEDELEIEGEPALTVFTVDEILTALDGI